MRLIQARRITTTRTRYYRIPTDMGRRKRRSYTLRTLAVQKNICIHGIPTTTKIRCKFAQELGALFDYWRCRIHRIASG